MLITNVCNSLGINRQPSQIVCKPIKKIARKSSFKLYLCNRRLKTHKLKPLTMIAWNGCVKTEINQPNKSKLPPNFSQSTEGFVEEFFSDNQITKPPQIPIAKPN